MRRYFVKEVFVTLQGEGAHAGRAAVFCRFAGCNLWTGREADRDQAVCQFCDTQFVGTDGPGGGAFTRAELVSAICAAWEAGGGPVRDGKAQHAMVVLTGGEPLLQVEGDLVDGLRDAGFYVALETNGSLPLPCEFDWVTVSPKSGAKLVVRKGDELKLVVPQLWPDDLPPTEFRRYSVQPMAVPDLQRSAANLLAAIEWVRSHPSWYLGVQLHKMLGLP